MKKQIEYVDNLDKSIKNVLSWYTTDNGYKFLNSALRNKKEKYLNDDFKNKLNLIDKAFLLAPKISKPITVYRGLDLKSSEDITFHTNSFISATTDIESTYSFTSSTNNCCILKINVASGSKILPLKNLSTVKHEDEILLDRYGIINATYKYEKDKMIFIDCVYIPEDSIEIKSEKDIKQAKKEFTDDEIIDKLIYIIEDELDLIENIDDLNIELKLISEKTNYKLNKNILEKIKYKLGF